MVHSYQIQQHFLLRNYAGSIPKFKTNRVAPMCCARKEQSLDAPLHFRLTDSRKASIQLELSTNTMLFYPD